MSFLKSYTDTFREYQRLTYDLNLTKCTDLNNYNSCVIGHKMLWSVIKPLIYNYSDYDTFSYNYSEAFIKKYCNHKKLYYDKLIRNNNGISTMNPFRFWNCKFTTIIEETEVKISVSHVNNQAPTKTKCSFRDDSGKKIKFDIPIIEDSLDDHVSKCLDVIFGKLLETKMARTKLLEDTKLKYANLIFRY